MDAATPAPARFRRFLEREPVVWLSTVRPDGRPHLVPIWFTWDGKAVLVFSKPHAQKVRNLRANPTLMLALGEADEDFDVGLVEARAELADGPADGLPAEHLRKYGARMAELGLTPNEFVQTYSQVIRIVPTRFLPWHGRTTPVSVRATVSIDEPRRDYLAAAVGEPLAVPPVGEAPRDPIRRVIERVRRALEDLGRPVVLAPRVGGAGAPAI